MNLDQARKDLAHYNNEHAKIAPLYRAVEIWVTEIVDVYFCSGLINWASEKDTNKAGYGVDWHNFNYLTSWNLPKEGETYGYVEFDRSNDDVGWANIPAKYFVENGVELIKADQKAALERKKRNEQKKIKAEERAARAKELRIYNELKAKYERM
jgi:hypothetical protein